MELIRYSVSEYGFHVPTSITNTIWKQAFKELGQDAPSPASDAYELEDKEYKNKLRNQQDNNQVFLSPSWTVEQVSELITDDAPFHIACGFAEEDLDNLGLSKLGEYEVDISLIEQSIKNKGFEDKELRKWLRVATKDFLDTLLISLDASQEVIDNGFLSKKRKEVFNLLKENSNNKVVAQIKHFAQKVEEGKQFIKDAKEELEQAYEEYYQHYRDAKDTLKEAKANLQNDINSIVNYTAYELNEQKQEVYENHNQALKKAREKKKREKARFQKLLAFSEGVALASIDGIAPQYIQAAQEIGNQVMKVSNDMIAGHRTQGVEAGSEEQTKLVVKGITKVVKDLIKQKASDDVLSVKKSLAASDTPEIILNNGNSTNGKVTQTVSAGSN
ncbi:MAG: hypothetical protein QNJ65_08485 [Xenococcaceae cyanobacterium MO_234.B1]|nr:hypothetical protein [Xenococcaceae cyanobacterium MO_234.B1]